MDQHVIVVGGGNSAGQAAMFLADHAHKVTMVVRNKALTATLSRHLVDRILAHPKIEVRYETAVTELAGEDYLERVTLKTGSAVAGEWVNIAKMFVCIGGVPNTEWAKDTKIIRDGAGYLITGPDLLNQGKPPDCWPLRRAPYYLETSVPGSFAAGDVRHRTVNRVASAVGEGAMALTFVHRYLTETAN